MQVNGEMALAGGGIDRAAHLRRDVAVLAELLAEAMILPLWEGRLPMVRDGESAALVWLDARDPGLAAAGPALFLGLWQGRPRFARPLPEGSAANAVGGPFAVDLVPHPALVAPAGFADLRGTMAGLSPAEAELAATALAVTGWHKSHGFCAACGAASQPTQGGWRRDCPSCGAQHFPRTDPVVIMRIVQGNALLMGRSPGWPEGMYSCLAGFVEPGETLEAAVRREVLEETGVPVGPVRLIRSQPWPFPASLMIGAEGVALDRALTLDPLELEDAIWISRERMLAIFAGQDPAIRPPRRGTIARALVANWLADRRDCGAN